MIISSLIHSKEPIPTRKGWCPITGKGQRFLGKEAVKGNISSYWVWKHLMSQLCWQHTKLISPNKNPPGQSKGVINVNSYAHGGGIDLDPVQRAKALQTVNFRFLNYQDTPFQA